MNTTANMRAAEQVADAARPTAKVRQRAVVRFPYQVHSGITPAMNRAIERMTAGNSLMAAADVIRMSLHNYLLMNDPLYQRELGGPHA
jgi:Tfp pilus assembly protein FimV